MLTLYSYPGLFGVADNNPYGLKVYAFLKLSRLVFRHRHLFEAKAAPRGQLPYIEDDGVTIGDSDAIVAYLLHKHRLDIDRPLTTDQRGFDLLVRRMLDDLYWVISYSRWRDDRFWPLFRDNFLSQHPNLTQEGMDAARQYNFQRYFYQGIGRFEPDQVYARGLADLEVLAESIGSSGFLFGPRWHIVDTGIYGFLANIHFFKIETPLKTFLTSRPNLVRYCEALHEAVSD